MTDEIPIPFKMPLRDTFRDVTELWQTIEEVRAGILGIAYHVWTQHTLAIESIGPLLPAEYACGLVYDFKNNNCVQFALNMFARVGTPCVENAKATCLEHKESNLAHGSNVYEMPQEERVAFGQFMYNADKVLISEERPLFVFQRAYKDGTYMQATMMLPPEMADMVGGFNA